MTPGFLRTPAAAAVLAALPGARAVGGAVRDHLAGRTIHDVDVAVPLPPGEVAQKLRAAGLRVFETGLAHGTLTAVKAGEPIEVTSLRRDVATDGRHAEVEWTTDWRQDAARRDFTINAMSMEASGALHDHFGGVEDLRAGRVRFVGDPATRLAEDYLRALRFFRFQARYGQGAPDAVALGAIAAAVPGLARLSAERVWAELKRILEAPDPCGALALMRGTGVLGAVLPEAAPCDLRPLARLVERDAPRLPLLRLAALLTREANHVALARRLKLSGEEAERLALLLDQSALPPADASDAQLRVWRSLVALDDPPDAAGPLWLAEARDEVSRAALRARIEGPAPRFPLQGRDGLELGLAPGPALGAALREVQAWWRETGALADHAACRERLRQLVARGKG